MNVSPQGSQYLPDLDGIVRCVVGDFPIFDNNKLWRLMPNPKLLSYEARYWPISEQIQIMEVGHSGEFPKALV